MKSKNKILIFFTMALLLVAVGVSNATFIGDILPSVFTGDVEVQGALTVETIESPLTINNMSLGGNSLIFKPKDDYYRYTVMSFQPELRNESDVIIQVHKCLDPAVGGSVNCTDPSDEHKHLSIYTTNSSNDTIKRLDLDYGVDSASFHIQNSNIELDNDYGNIKFKHSIDQSSVQLGRLSTNEGLVLRSTNTASNPFTSFLIQNNTGYSFYDFDLNKAKIDVPLIEFYPSSSAAELSEINIATRSKFGYEGSTSSAFIKGSTGKNVRIYTNENSLTANFKSDGNTELIGNLKLGDGSAQKNITMTSPDANEWCCGVDNSGTFSCTAGACS